MSAASDDSEWGKRITSALLSGPVYILLDNINKALNSASLAMALTTRTYKDRLLGGNHISELPVENVWLATGNCLHASAEIARRMVRIGLNANCERPENRTGFKHDNISCWCQEHRSEVVWSLLILCKAWIAAGKPSGKQSMGSYEAWSATVGGILSVAGIDGFLANRGKLFSEINTSDAEWRELIRALAQQFTSNSFGAKDAVAVAVEKGLLIGVHSEARDPCAKMGHALGKQLGKVYGDWKVVSANDSHANANRYRLEWIGTTKEELPPPASTNTDDERRAILEAQSCRSVWSNSRAIEPIVGTQDCWRGGIASKEWDVEPTWLHEFPDRKQATEWGKGA